MAGSNISLENVDSVLALAAGRTGGRVMLPHGIIVRKDYKYHVFSCGRDRQAGKKEGERKIKIPGRTRFGNSCLSARFVRKVSRFNDGKNKVYFDAAKIEKENLMVRTRKEGDRFRPFGMAGTKKLKDLFIDEKVGIAERDSIPLLVEGGTILWVVGLRRSGYAPVSGSAKKILELKFEKDRIK